MKRKIFALVLCLSLCLGILPAAASALEAPKPLDVQPAVQIDSLPQAPELITAGSHSITMNVTGQGGTAQLYAASANTGDTVRFLANPDPGYRVDLAGSYYYGSVEPQLYYVGMDMYELVMPDGDVVLEVAFVQITSSSHAVSVDANVGGSVSVSQSAAKKGESILLEVVTSPGYTLDYVGASYSGGYCDAFQLGTVDGVDLFEIFMPDGDMTISVQFTRNGPYDVACVVEGGEEAGTVELSHTQAYEAETVTITAIPADGYLLESVGCRWSPVTSIGGNQYTFQMPRHAETVYVTFKCITYDLSVTVEYGIGGTATLNTDKGVVGDTIILVCQPYEGYRVARVTGIGMEDKGGNFYTFTMPEEPVSIQVLFLRENNPFLDVNETLFFHDPVLWAVESGITSGIDAEHFGPYGMCNRAQVVTFLWRSAGSPEPVSQDMPFTDVPADSWYADAVLWAVENGITSGTGADTFNPNGICNRAQVVTFLWRSAGSPAHSVEANPFTDVADDTWYADAVLWALENAVTSGSSDTTFNPNGECLRAQVVTFLYRAAMLSEK